MLQFLSSYTVSILSVGPPDVGVVDGNIDGSILCHQKFYTRTLVVVVVVTDPWTIFSSKVPGRRPDDLVYYTLFRVSDPNLFGRATKTMYDFKLLTIGHDVLEMSVQILIGYRITFTRIL